MRIRIAGERLFLRSPNINVCFRIKLDGELNPEDFAAAMDIVCRRHPLLQCSVTKDEDNTAWFVPNPRPVEVEYLKQEEMQDWKLWYKEKDGIPFDLLHENPVRIACISGDNQSEIIILGHHIIGDGTAYLNLAKDLLSALDNRLEASPQIPPANHTFIKGRKLSLLSRLYAGKLNKEWRRSRKLFSENDYLDFFRDYRNRYIPRIYTDSIREGDLQRLTAMCRSNNLTVNEVITAAFALALAADKEVRIGVAAGTRGELTSAPHNCMGNYVTGISVKATCVAGNNFIASAKNIAEMLRRELTDPRKRHAIVNFLSLFDGDLIESIMFASYGNYQSPVSKQIGRIIAEGSEGRGLGISNLGRHEIDNHSAFRLSDLEFIGPAFPANILSVSIITVNNKLNLCLRYNEADMDEDTARRVCREAMKLMLG